MSEKMCIFAKSIIQLSFTSPLAMETNAFSRYAWLFDVLDMEGPITFKQLCERWLDDGLGNGRPLSKRTFHQHCNKIESLFGVTVKCDPGKGYAYYLSGHLDMDDKRIDRWMLDSLTLENQIIAARNLRGRVLFERIERGAELLQPVVNAMRFLRELKVDYEGYGKSRFAYRVHPYALRAYHRRWYLLGLNVDNGRLVHFALDRMLDLETTDTKFVMPDDFDAGRYYANFVGIEVNEALTPQKVLLRVYGRQVDCLRTSPLHASQREIYSKKDAFSNFEYFVCLTPELTSEILVLGDQAEVLEPAELREKVRRHLLSALARYPPKND